MSNFERAKTFFYALEDLKGWDVCKEFVAEGAEFTGQCEPLLEVKTVKDYVGWVTELGTVIAPGSKYELHASGHDEGKDIAIFFATFSGTHTGEGGPVAPTNKTTNTDYVYVMQMNPEGKITKMTKIWNAPWALRELGWM